MNETSDKGQRLYEVISNHYEGLESQIMFHEMISHDPLGYAREIVQSLHTDLLLMVKHEGMPIWEESIRQASLAARILEVITGEETCRRYQGDNWRSLD